MSGHDLLEDEGGNWPALTLRDDVGYDISPRTAVTILSWPGKLVRPTLKAVWTTFSEILLRHAGDVLLEVCIASSEREVLRSMSS